MLRVLLLSKIICSLLKSEDVGMPQDLTAVLSKDTAAGPCEGQVGYSVQSDISYYRVVIKILMEKRSLK